MEGNKVFMLSYLFFWKFPEFLNGETGERENNAKSGECLKIFVKKIFVLPLETNQVLLTRIKQLNQVTVKDFSSQITKMSLTQ